MQADLANELDLIDLNWNHKLGSTSEKAENVGLCSLCGVM